MNRSSSLVGRHCLALLLALACLLTAARSARAILVGPAPTYEEVIRRTEVIFCGTITGIHSYKVPTRSLCTAFEFDNVRYAKGEGPRAGLVLTNQGGRTDSIEVITEGFPNDRFEVGHRYIVFTRLECINGSTEPVCVNGPSFEVVADSSFPSPIVRRGDRTVVRFGGNPLVCLDTDQPQDWGIRVTENTVMQRLAEIAALEALSNADSTRAK